MSEPSREEVDTAEQMTLWPTIEITPESRPPFTHLESSLSIEPTLRIPNPCPEQDGAAPEWALSRTTDRTGATAAGAGMSMPVPPFNSIEQTTGSEMYNEDLQEGGGDGTTIIAGEEFNWTAPVQTGDNMDDLLSWLFNPSPNDNTSLLNPDTIPLDNPPYVMEFENPNETNMASPGSQSFKNHSQTQKTLHTLSQRPPSRMRSTYPKDYIPRVLPQAPSHNIYPDLSERWSSWEPWQAPPRREIIDEEARPSMLALFDNNARKDLMAPSFSLQQMRLYLELYFMHFAPLYPIIHQASLPYRKLPPDLLLAMICVGTAFANDPEGLEMASKVHKHLRTRVFDMVEDEPTASVSSLQTILLLNHFARSFCSLKQHDVAQIFHSPIINLARQSGMLLPNYDRKLLNTLDDPMACWLEWVDEEERKRLGWFSFMMDTENAALYRGFLLIHCYLIDIDLPDADEIWESPNPLVWNKNLNNSPRPPSFRSALRELAGRGSIAPNLTKFHLWMLLHGLHCVQWTLLWRDLGDLSMVHVSKITSWKDSLRVSFDTWRTYIEEHYGTNSNRNANTNMNSNSNFGVMSGQVQEHPMVSAGIPFSHLGTVLLLSDSEQIRIFAGTKKIAGRPISPGEWAAANMYVNSWAKSQDGAYCCHGALRLLAHVFRWSSETKFQRTSMVPWCVYLATLIVWSYASALDGLDSLQAPFIIITPSSRTGHLDHQVRIEPSLAQRSAMEYLENALSCEHPFALPSVKDKNKCAGIVAYTAYLAGTLKRGVMEECRTVLLGLLTEHV
ncbi:uncharacterized protein I303_106965 [Kwoniella dejecticola CBS 10117]|uniref:Xylanolytic transcriptional activator regulatory domain-containing protein n=1 Tax=Kwoniella dejecticola CBS 10117 TaxID=1296121 RepID=A0A1A5ZYC2_9TREE|nr:uncharacterized protein I303_06366 [Kwoniella dejecticola CBS 10117]OBR82809.1 hypothetical protein I303_06366 [Kwoniella dejecticola CBS 10117]